MPKPKNPNNYYFPTDIETHIVEFNTAVTQAERDRIWNTYLQYPCHKLCENIFNSFITRNNKLLNENSATDWIDLGVARCMELMTHINYSKGKAYSFLTVCIRRYYTANNIKLTREFNHNVNYNNVIETEEEDSPTKLPTELIHHDPEDISVEKYFVLLTQYIEEHADELCTAPSHRKLIGPLISTMKDIMSVEFSTLNYNKQKNIGTHTIYKHMRDHYGFVGVIKTGHRKFIEKLGKIHNAKYKEYFATGLIRL